MQFFRNKIIIGVLCIVLGLVVGFVLIPGSRDAQNASIQVVRATQDIPQGSCIDETMIEAVTVLASQVNLTESRVDDFIGSYAATKIYTGDYLTAEKLNPTAVDPIAAATERGKMIVSVTVPSLAASASGIIQPGDVVMLMASGVDPEDYNESSSGTQIQNNIATGGNTLHYDNETNQFYYVLIQDNGEPIHPQSVSRWFERFCERNDLPKISLHKLRHTSASILIGSGASITTVSQRLGHSQVSTTLDVYSHQIKQRDAAAAEDLGKVLYFGKNTEKNQIAR